MVVIVKEAHHHLHTNLLQQHNNNINRLHKKVGSYSLFDNNGYTPIMGRIKSISILGNKKHEPRIRMMYCKTQLRQKYGGVSFGVSKSDDIGRIF